MPNPVVHFEIGCIDTAAQTAFYGKLFGWEITPPPPSDEWKYNLVQPSEGGIGGGISQSVDHPPKPMVTFYVQVDDLRTYLDQAITLGAAEVLPPMAIEYQGRRFAIAAFTDPEGNYIGLYKDG